MSAATRYPDHVPAALRAEWTERGLYPGVPGFELFRRQAGLRPDAVAVFDESGETTYAALLDASRRIAAGLRRLGVGPGETVACQLPNSWQAVAVDLALAALGAVSLPFPVGRGDRDVRALISRSGATTLIVPARYREVDLVALVAGIAPELPSLERLVVLDEQPSAPGSRHLDATSPERPGVTATFAALLAEEPLTDAELPEVPATAIARLLVSSGTESDPKIVAYSHDALIGGRGRFLARLQVDGRPMRAMYMMPLGSSFASGATLCVLALLGGSLVLRRGFEAGDALEAIGRCRPTHLLGVPTMYQHLVGHSSIGSTDTSSVECVITGGALIDPATAERCTRLLGRTMVSLYGSADGVNCHTAVDDPPHIAQLSVGRPDPDVCAIRILDESGAECPQGAVGEVTALGPMSPHCYVNAPELNERYRLPGGWVRTGDRGWIDEDGRLCLAGRAKDVIIRGGGNISPAELETVSTGHPGVLGIACVPVPDGELGQRVCACLVPDRADAPTLASLVTFLREEGMEPRKLPEYLLVLDRLPLGAAGKVDKKALAALAEEQFAELARAGRRNGVVPGCERDLRGTAAALPRPRRTGTGRADPTALAHAVREFVEQEILPAEHLLRADTHGKTVRALRERARDAGLWGLGFPRDLGGAGLSLAGYLLIAEQEGRSEFGPPVLGGDAIVDVRMLHTHAKGRLRERYLEPLVRGDLLASFGMTEPGSAGSHPRALRTAAVADGPDWVLNGRKWFVSNAGRSDVTLVVARTTTGGEGAPGGEEAPAGKSAPPSFSVFLVPTEAPGFVRVRPLPVLGQHAGQWEIAFEDLRLPGHHLLGEPGAGMEVASERLGIGRTLRSMHWLGTAQRAFDLMCRRLREREVHGGLLGDQQLMREHAFTAYSSITAARELVLGAAHALDRGGDARVAVSAAKVTASRVAVDVVDRAVQVFGAEGLGDDQPLSAMARRLRATRILDGPDEVHITSAAGRLLRTYATSATFDFSRPPATAAAAPLSARTATSTADPADSAAPAAPASPLTEAGIA
ncbi:AMP-binding protein [Streptomyces sp. MW-W600-10]|uniref:AMP-binding protein n=1 Tax=Streptomyces sp. MW-W600-10 TaxID=2829819 RepID=UPI001C46E181|nr:AMP-binding protein [Streptomyces sp. MW-W600-10]MBV7246350.1 AMP-binding protein [Streptomyces sp. MW-W600-10]